MHKIFLQYYIIWILHINIFINIYIQPLDLCQWWRQRSIFNYPVIEITVISQCLTLKRLIANIGPWNSESCREIISERERGKSPLLRIGVRGNILYGFVWSDWFISKSSYITYNYITHNISVFCITIIKNTPPRPYLSLNNKSTYVSHSDIYIYTYIYIYVGVGYIPGPFKVWEK